MKPKRKIAWTVALSVLFLSPHLVGCGGGGGSSGTSDPARTAVGYVKDAATQGAVAGASVTLGGRSATTASDGRYQITGLPAGELVRGVAAPNYSHYVDTVTLQPGVNTLTDVNLVEAPPLPPPP